jgi:CRP-like cAMP-binding protein/Fe-S-cluster-containing hydrogenase component 2
MFTQAKNDISKISLFSGIDQTELLPILTDCEIKEFVTGDYIYRRGEYGGDCGIVLSGSVNVELPWKKGKSKNSKVIIEEGGIFGEIAAMSGYTRIADVAALSLTRVFFVPRDTLFKLIDKFHLFKNRIDELYRQRTLKTHLRTIPIFKALPDQFLEDLAGKITLHSYRKGDVIFKQGDEADAFYLVRYGFVKVTEIGSDNKERVLAYLKAGHYFGEMALFNKERKRMATVTAINRTELIRISIEDFLNIIESFPFLGDSFRKAIEKREARNVQIREDDYIGGILDAIVGTGVIHAKGILAVDITKCINCDRCVNACAVLHNNQSRLIRKGVRVNNVLLIVASCRHCYDPTCMIECCTGAIARDYTGEIYHKNFCIGCGKCARSCPYGNISIINIPVTEGDKDQSKADAGNESKLKIFRNAVKNKKFRKQAVKCDMCREYSFVGCVYNCPMGAAQKIDPTEFFADIITVG